MALILLLLLASILFIFLQDSMLYQIGPNPTSKKVQDKLAEHLPEDLQGPIYELGSGFGQMSFFLSKRYPKCLILSYERARIPFLIQKIWLMLKFQKQIELKFEDFLKKDISDAKLIFCYLYPAIMSKIAEKFYQEASPGTWLITHTFAMRAATPKRVIIADDLYQTPIYFYQR